MYLVGKNFSIIHEHLSYVRQQTLSQAQKKVDLFKLQKHCNVNKMVSRIDEIKIAFDVLEMEYREKHVKKQNSQK